MGFRKNRKDLLRKLFKVGSCMNEEQAKDLADRILKDVFKNGQYADVTYKHRGKDIHIIKIDVSIKITK